MYGVVPPVCSFLLDLNLAELGQVMLIVRYFLRLRKYGLKSKFPTSCLRASFERDLQSTGQKDGCKVRFLEVMGLQIGWPVME